jgi:hypothetical protein
MALTVLNFYHLTNKDKSCERSEPRSILIFGQVHMRIGKPICTEIANTPEPDYPEGVLNVPQSFGVVYGF